MPNEPQLILNQILETQGEFFHAFKEKPATTLQLLIQLYLKGIIKPFLPKDSAYFSEIYSKTPLNHHLFCICNALLLYFHFLDRSECLQYNIGKFNNVLDEVKYNCSPSFQS